MLRILLLSTFIFITNILSAQKEHEISLVHEKLDQFYNVRDFSISQLGDEVFFTVQSPNGEISQIVTMSKEKEEWSEPELLPFCDVYMYLEPFLSASGNRLFFVSNRPLNTTTKAEKDFDIWYVERSSVGSKWSKPKNIGKPINSDLDEFYPSVSENNNLYFTMDSPDGLGKDDIYFCQWDTDRYLPPVRLDENINSSGYEFNAFISKNEDFMLFTKYNEKGGQGSGDLYIAKKDANGKWQKSTNIGVPINTKYMEYCPFYDEKNQILYFTSKRQKLPTKEFQTISDFKKYIHGSKNGLSKLYKTSIKLQ